MIRVLSISLRIVLLMSARVDRIPEQATATDALPRTTSWEWPARNASTCRSYDTRCRSWSLRSACTRRVPSANRRVGLLLTPRDFEVALQSRDPVLKVGIH